MNEHLTVWFEEKKVGTLFRVGKIHMVFRYASSWCDDPVAFPLSLALPLQETAFSPDVTRAFFDNLLPEEESRKIVGKHLQVSVKNPFGFLKAIGLDCAGALSISPDGPVVNAFAVEEISSAQLETIIRELPQRPLLAGEGQLRLSLAGAQPKLPLIYSQNRYFLTIDGTPSTHILKPAIPAFPETCENEFFCLFLGEKCGLGVPTAILTETVPRALLVKRYDRCVKKEQVTRIHQEDFCQALSVVPEIKYENEGGPNLTDCFSVLAKCRNPNEDRLRLFRWCVFNHLIGNADAHGKNLSLLYDVPPQPQLAPFYDLLCTEVYAGHETKMAMKIGKQNQPAYLFGRHWIRLGELAGLDGDTSLAVLAKDTIYLQENVFVFADKVCKHIGESPMVRQIADFVVGRCEQTLARLAM